VSEHDGNDSEVTGPEDRDADYVPESAEEFWEAEEAQFVAETSEGAQELLPRSATGATDLRREVGAVLRLPEGNVVNPNDIDFERRDDETMIINMGPQHPSTHGVLRLMLELDGETVLRTKPIIGYLHTGMEKTAEELTYVQGATNVTRMDYLSPLSNELVFAMATEALLDVEVPPRAVWIRMLMAELSRVSSHLMWMATNGMDLGSTSMMIYGFREREMVLSFFEKTAGLRMNLNYIRPGGVAADLPDGWQDDIDVICDTILARTFEYDELLTGQPIFRERTEAVGNLSAEEGLALSITGPILRSTGVPWDLRRTMPYLAYDQLDFDVIVGTYGDNFDRYSVRLNEIRESIRMIRQIAEKMPPGDYRVQDRKVTPPPRARIDESMEALIHHFKIFTEGFRVPEGEVYVAIESPRGELGCYMVSDGTSKPYRMHFRGPSFVNLQVLPVLLRGGLMADAVAVISSVDPVMGEVDR
jgi:NADH-quinone oxidoreductase subunit D